MPKTNDSIAYPITTLRLLADDALNAAKEIERQCDLARSMGLDSIDLRYTATAEKSVGSFSNFAQEVKRTIRATTIAKDDAMIEAADREIEKVGRKRAAKKSTQKPQTAKKKPFLR
jgi:hypothetical protein